MLEALDGPLYVGRSSGLSKPILLRLNEFLLKHSEEIMCSTRCVPQL